MFSIYKNHYVFEPVFNLYVFQVSNATAYEKNDDQNNNQQIALIIMNNGFL